ncbi:hypothetical protein NL676_020052 [Syzygium grande]|nr:hypothetical protein NL676_020052 [Syzygium grande]
MGVRDSLWWSSPKPKPMHAYSDANEVRYEHGSTGTATFPTYAREPTSHPPLIQAISSELSLLITGTPQNLACSGATSSRSSPALHREAAIAECRTATAVWVLAWRREGLS